jgi:hypothetical protein
MHIVRWVFLIFGILEILSNLYHLSGRTTKEVSRRARLQHGELPKNLPDNHFVWKAWIMFVFGCAFFTAGLLINTKSELIGITSLVVAALFGFYGIVQAIVYYRHWTVYTSAIVYNLPLALLLILHRN